MLVATKHDTLSNLRWRNQATCRDLDPKLFFPVGVTGRAIPQIEAAKEICQNCASKDECLEFAITTNQEYGVWGGKTEEERRVLRRQWRIQLRRNRQLAS